jgi:hypothetical protein
LSCTLVLRTFLWYFNCVLLIKEAKKQGQTLRKEEKSKDKTARSRDRKLYKQLN